jgi:hypothetical protein
MGSYTVTTASYTATDASYRVTATSYSSISLGFAHIYTLRFYLKIKLTENSQMTKKDGFRFDMFIRVVEFIKNNIADFPAGVVAAQLVVLESVISTLQTLAGEQSAGMSEARFQHDSKDTARENLREMLSDIAETARSMVYKFPGIDLKFRMIRGNSDVDLLAKARAFAAEAATYEADFIDFEMDEDFLTDLTNLITAFEQAMNAPATPIAEHVEATADIGAEIGKGMIAVRTIDAPIKNKYRGNPGKTSAWVSASHVEREPKPTTLTLKKKTDNDKTDDEK